MILDLSRFIVSERPSWERLEKFLDKIEDEPDNRMTLNQARDFHYLYQKVASDLARISTFSAEPELKKYLENLTARAYAEINETRDRGQRWAAFQWFTLDFPRVFRKHIRAFGLSLLVTFVGVVFGAGVVLVDNEAKEALLPGMFANHLGSPSERVAEEEAGKKLAHLNRSRSSFAGFLMANNIKVSILTLCLGMTFGFGSFVSLFYNGIMLGLICADYVRDGQTVFLLAWLLPHGSIELPAIFIAGQGGFVLAKALIGWSDRHPLATRMRLIVPDLMVLIGGIAVMLVWAGIIEAFMSQYHHPVLPYWIKITFGMLELGALIAFLGWAGREKSHKTIVGSYAR